MIKKKSTPESINDKVKSSENEYTDKEMKTFEKQLLQDLKKYKDDNIELKKLIEFLIKNILVLDLEQVTITKYHRQYGSIAKKSI